MVEIRPISTSKSDLKKYVQFGTDLYKDSPYYVPPLMFDDINTLTPARNPAFDFCSAQSFMAYRDGRPVGRITGIINNQVNERTGQKSRRFGLTLLTTMRCRRHSSKPRPNGGAARGWTQW